MASVLFSPIQLRGLTIPNRVTVSPMCQYSATNGVVGDWHLAHLGQFAQSGPGLVFVEATGVDCVAFDQAVDPVWARDHLQGMATVQGNLDPGLLLKRGDEMRRAVDHLIETLGQGPFIFNLGHGVLPGTPAENVKRLVEFVHEHGTT